MTSTIRYKSCAFDGARSQAILSFREAIAEAVGAVQSELAKLNDLTAETFDEAVVVVGQDPSDLFREPLDTTQAAFDTFGNHQPTTISTISVYPNPGKNGGLVDGKNVFRYRTGPVYDTRGGLVGSTELSAAHWAFLETTPTAQLNDSSFLSKHASRVTGSAPSVEDGGPLGKSRTFDASTYFTIATGQAPLGIGQSLLTFRENFSAWGWVKTSSSFERPIITFSSPASTQLAGTASVTKGSVTVTGTGTSFGSLFRGDRIVFSSQPNKVYNVVSPANPIGAITNSTVIQLGSEYTGVSNSTATMLRCGLYDADEVHSAANAATVPPESRNTLFGLGIDPVTDQVRAYWQHQNRVDVEAVNDDVAIGPDEYVFVGFQRYLRKLAGTVTRDGVSNVIIGVGTSFVSEFGIGAVTDKWLRFDGDRFDGDSRYYKIVSVASNTILSIDPENYSETTPWASVPLSAASDVGVWSLRTMVHVGKLDGTFSTKVIKGLPGATGGCEPEPVTLLSRGNLYIGHDENTLTNFFGSMNALSIYGNPVDTSEDPDEIDRVMYFFYSRAFADYIVEDATIRRNIVSDIPDGGTIYCNYRYQTGITATQGTTDRVTGQLDDILIGSNNSSVKNTSQLAQTIGAPDPALQSDEDLLSQSLVRYGLVVSNGHPLVRGTTDLTSYNALVQTVGSVDEADSLILNKPPKSIILVAITEDMREVASVDSCGRPTTTIIITERIVGVNRNLNEAAMFAGFADTAALKLKLWWIGEAGIDDSSVQKLRLLGLTGSQIASAMSLVSSDKLKVYVIPIPTIHQRLLDGGMLPDDIEQLATKRPEDLIPIQTDPDTSVTAAAVQIAIAAPPGATVDGDPNPQNPALVVASVVDLKKAFKVEQTDIDALFGSLLNQADADCAALIAILDDLLGNLTRTIAQISNALVPFALHQNASIGTQKLAFTKYVPCIMNLSAAFSLPPFTIKIDFVTSLLKHLLEETVAVVHQAETIVERFDTLLCIPKTLIAALRGGICGIEQPKVVAGRQCPPQVDLLLDRLQQLIDTIELLLRKLLVALTSFSADIEITIGGTSRLAVDASLPCVGPVANFLLALG